MKQQLVKLLFFTFRYLEILGNVLIKNKHHLHLSGINKTAHKVPLSPRYLQNLEHVFIQNKDHLHLPVMIWHRVFFLKRQSLGSRSQCLRN